MKYEDLIKQFQSDKYAPVILLCGEESYYIDEATAYIEQHALDDMAREFDQMVLYGKDLAGADIAPVIGQARGFAMMGGRKVIIVKEAQTIKKWDALAAYMDNPQPSSVLVLCYKYGNPDKRLNVWKTLEKKGGVIMQSDKLRDYQVAGWITQYLHNEVDPKVSQLLAEYIGNDLTAIVGALRKLVDGRPEGVTTITPELVERNIGISKDYNVFELQDALIRGDVLKANRITHYFASSKDHPMVKELGILFGFFQNLMLYHYLSDKSDRAVAAALGINPFFVKDYAAAAKRYNAMKTFRIIGYFRDTDARLKGINNPSAKDEDLWKELIYRILH
ncbi:MAG: DNA polymerase III subunit delta [Paludibacteraceae bacterium]|nr:DNA polymerase III subunit delta [Paludibacteraceae bacterium]